MRSCSDGLIKYVSVLMLIAFASAPAAQAKRPVVLYAFQGGIDGAYPHAGVIRDSKGNLYGTTFTGGANEWGIVFKVAPNGSETVLYTFTGGSDGGSPFGGVIADQSGNLYGTTYAGGIAEGYSGYGVVFKVTPQGSESVLYTFTGGNDGGYPWGGLSPTSPEMFMA